MRKKLIVSKRSILSQVTNFFLKSHDFNGIPSQQLCEIYCKTCHGKSPEEFIQQLIQDPNCWSYEVCLLEGTHLFVLQKYLEELVSQGSILVVSDINPHIKRNPEQDISIQLSYLKDKFDDVCLYPSQEILAKKIKPDKCIDKPFTRRLWLGEAQLTPVFFELEILEWYAKDPRFDFRFNDYSGGIYLKEVFHESNDTQERDKIFLDHFGIGYDENGYRCVIVWLYDLNKLSPEHQQRWKTFLITSQCIIDPDYYRNAIFGEWAEEVSIYLAFIEELKIINQFCIQIGWPPIFRDDYTNNRPEDFRFPFLSTKEAYYRSAEILDKMISQNMNMKFFKKVLPEHELYEMQKHSSGVDSPTNLGTLKLLAKWIQKSFKPSDGGELLSHALKTFEIIRAIRQTPAHKINANAHDKYYYKLHDKMISEAYIAIRTIRLLLANHPYTDSSRVIPEWLYDGKIRSFSMYDIEEIPFKS